MTPYSQGSFALNLEVSGPIVISNIPDHGGVRSPDYGRISNGRRERFTRSFAIITTDANALMAELQDSDAGNPRTTGLADCLGEVEGDPATLLRPAGDDVLKVDRSESG